MKVIFFIRHAKSDQSYFGKDFDRPLNERGKKDAPVMAQRVKEKNMAIDAFVASPAIRAKTTAEIFCDIFNRKKEEIIFNGEFYNAPSYIYGDLICSFDDAFNSVALFAHNPGITNFVNSIVYEERINEMPTCGVFAVEAEADKWVDFEQSKKRFLFFDYPKNM